MIFMKLIYQEKLRNAIHTNEIQKRVNNIVITAEFFSPNLKIH